MVPTPSCRLNRDTGKIEHLERGCPYQQALNALRRGRATVSEPERWGRWLPGEAADGTPRPVEPRFFARNAVTGELEYPEIVRWHAWGAIAVEFLKTAKGGTADAYNLLLTMFSEIAGEEFGAFHERIYGDRAALNAVFDQAERRLLGLIAARGN